MGQSPAPYLPVDRLLALLARRATADLAAALPRLRERALRIAAPPAAGAP